jgi:tRNA (guanine-N7-)-methyltransferase
MRLPMNNMLDPNDFIITRKRKKYKFALFHNSPLCFEADSWPTHTTVDVVEIGAGTGLFGVALATANTTKQIVAIDVKADRLQTGARLAEQEDLNNIRFLRAHVRQLDDLFAASTITSIWVTFPDPFPKDRHAKHRLTHPNFLKLYAKLLRPDGALFFKTDAKPLFEWSLEQLVVNGWTIRELSFDLQESELSQTYKTMTTYETRFTSEGIKTNFVKATPPQS